MVKSNARQWYTELKSRLAEYIASSKFDRGEVTLDVEHQQVVPLLTLLKEDDEFQFEQLIDLCGVDYLDYGKTEWETSDASGAGFSRGVETSHQDKQTLWKKARFAVVYHLLSPTNNRRVRVRCFVPEKTMIVPSVTDLWTSANWYEREAFDLFGIRFLGHDDLRRLLTDYGFNGYPFRKDFPLSGEVEIRYDATEQRCVYEPVSIEPRVLVPRVIRHDSRLQDDESERVD